MSTSADFTLNDTPQSDGVYRATAGGTVDLKLTDGLLIDAGVVKVTLERKTKGATDIPEIAAEYVLSPATATLTLNIPDEISSWMIRVQLNQGTNGFGRVEPTWTRERVIETVGLTETAKQLAGEMTQRHPARGWSDIQNDMVDALETLAAGGGPTPDPDPFEGLDVQTEHTAMVVEAGKTVSRWADQRAFRHWVPFERDLMLWYECNTVESIVADTAVDSIRKPLAYSADYDSGLPALSPPGGLWCRSPLVTNLAAFTIAMRIRMASGNGQSLLTLCNSFPSGVDDVPLLSLTWSYSAGPSGSFDLSLVDAAIASADASKSATHGSWHNLVLRHTGSSLIVRVDGVNGTPVSTAALVDDLTVDASSLGCAINSTDGTSPGFMAGGTAIRHILAAPRAWSDAECLVAEAALTAAWT